VPSNISSLFKQRIRWNLGGLQVVIKNKKLLFNRNYHELGTYLLPSNFYWYPFVLIIVPLIIFQILYWLPYQLDSVLKLFWYFFTWFSFAGPLNSIYMIPQWGFSIHTLLGILPAFITTSISLLSLKFFKEKIDIKNLIGVFFLFPYFFILNFTIILAVILHLLKIKYDW
jgi:cellulose synthase/poly-beta-1,6-N-acetylglucosamine synthase-like glycosyltransferase